MGINNHVLFEKKELRHFCVYRFIFGISYSFMIPIIPLFFDSIGIATVMIGTIMSLYGVSKTIMQIPFGLVSDKLGDKKTLILALLLMTFIPISYTFTRNQSIAGIIYIIQGGILGMAAPATFSILSRSLDEKKRGECTGFAASVFTLGGGIGAAIAGFIVGKDSNYDLVFYLSSLGILLTLIFVIFKVKKVSLNNKKSIDKKRPHILKEIRKNKLEYKVFVLGSIAFLGDYIYGCVVAMIHFYGQDVLGASTIYTSAIVSIYLMVFGIGAPLAGWVSDKIGNKRQLFLSFGVMNITLLLLAFTRNLNLFTIVIIAYFLGATFLNASLQSSLSEFGSNHRIKGAVFGFVGASESFGYALGPVISAYIYQINKEWLFFGLLSVSLLVSLIYLTLHKKANI